MFMERGISFRSSNCIVVVEKSGGSKKLNRYGDLAKATRQGGIIMTFRSPRDKMCDDWVEIKLRRKTTQKLSFVE